MAPIEQYTSAKAKRLAATFRPQLLKFSEQVYHCLPWVGVVKDGIGFRQPKGAKGDDRYLTVWISIDQADDGAVRVAHARPTRLRDVLPLRGGHAETVEPDPRCRARTPTWTGTASC